MKLPLPSQKAFQKFLPLGLTLYRWVCLRILRSKFTANLVAKLGTRWLPGLPARLTPPVLPPKQKQRIWCHVASVGELESVWSLLERITFEGRFELVLTSLSASALPVFEKFSKHLEALSPQTKQTLLFHGFSPLEGAWKSWLEVLQPDLFLTVKYEGWPELWGSLAQMEIPLLMIGARIRPSLKIVKTICNALCFPIPSLHLATFNLEDTVDLEEFFPKAHVFSSGDPRWDRIFQRAQVSSHRLKQLLQFFQKAPRPWGVLGSVYEEDLRIWRSSFQLRVQRKEIWWIVPHHTDAKTITAFKEFFKRQKVDVLVTSEISGASNFEEKITQFPEKPQKQPTGFPVILVDEQGFLAELYGAMDWAYVGGGFTAGLHNTMEPALFGIAVSGGPKKAHLFTEIEELSRSGQFKRVETPQELKQWLEFLPQFVSEENRQKWIAQVPKRLGATQRLYQYICTEGVFALPSGTQKVVL